MSKLKNNYTMGAAMDYCKRGKYIIVIAGILGGIFPYFPPYYLGFDPRFEEQIPPFFLYLTIYYMVYIGVLGKMTDNRRKLRKITTEKAILLGCPIEIASMGGRASNSYSTTVMVNEPMLALLRQLGADDEVQWQEESLALQEPFVEKFSMGSGTSAKFLGKNIPHFDKARKIGQVPDVSS